MILREVLVRPGIVGSKKVCKLPPATQLFFRNLLHVCDGAGRFEADADELRTVLYGRVLDRVTRAHVARWLVECRQADLIVLYTEKERGYGEVINYGQRDTKRKVRFPGRSPEHPAELPLTTGDPPHPPRKLNRREGSGRAAPDTPHLTDEQWLAGLAAAYPEINLTAELNACLVKYPLAGRKFFEDVWLPNAEPPMKGGRDEPAAEIPEPAGFVEWFTARYEKAPTRPWNQMRRDSQEYYTKLMNP